MNRPGDRNGKGSDHGISLVLPAYNEKNGILPVLEELRGILQGTEIPWEIIVVDDGSTDGTSDILQNLDDVKVISHEKNKGYGAAIKTGIRQAEFSWIAITDADGTYPNDRLPELMEAMRENDMVIGARTGAGARIPLVRKPAKWVLAKIANYLAQQKIPDLNSGLRIFTKSSVSKFRSILPNQFSFTTTITLAMLLNGYRVRFIPIDYHPRVGKSKIRPIYDTLNFLQLIIRTILYFDPLRVFLPLSLIFLLTGFALIAHRIWFGFGFGVTSVVMIVSGIQLLALGMLADLINKRLMLTMED